MRSWSPTHLLVLWLAALVALPGAAVFALPTAGFGVGAPIAPISTSEEEDSESEARAFLPSSCRRKAGNPGQRSRRTTAPSSSDNARLAAAVSLPVAAPSSLSVRHLVPRYGE